VLIVGFPAGAFQTNCYVVAPGAGQACVVVDPGQDAVEPLSSLLAEHKLTPVAVLLTHGHFDHTFSVAPVWDGNDVPAYIHPGDRDLLADPLKGLTTEMRQFFGGRLALREPREVRPLEDGTPLAIAGVDLAVEHAPGHTPGSMIFTTVADDGTPLVIAGDTLFAGSIGRTDFPGGDHRQMLASLRDRFLTRDDSTVVLPGHGPATTVGRERQSNPFLTGLDDPRRAGVDDSPTAVAGPSAAEPRRRGL
jgi:hydroxyacylglutathione hydrolase